jgi:hypothetical protein
MGFAKTNPYEYVSERTARIKTIEVICRTLTIHLYPSLQLKHLKVEGACA